MMAVQKVPPFLFLGIGSGIEEVMAAEAKRSQPVPGHSLESSRLLRKEKRHSDFSWSCFATRQEALLLVLHMNGWGIKTEVC